MTVAALLAGAILAGVACFQAALAIGVPWGYMAYGGQAAFAAGHLPTRLRVVSAIAVPILVLAAWMVLARADLVGRGPFPAGFVEVAVWVIGGYLVLNTLANLRALTDVERYGLGSLTAIAAIATFVVAILA